MSTMTAEQKQEFTRRMAAARTAKKAASATPITGAPTAATAKPVKTEPLLRPQATVKPLTTSKEGISLDRLQRLVPAAFALSPAPRVSDSYQFIRTDKLIEKLLKEGFTVVRATQNCTRQEDDALHTRHMLRFRRTEAKPLVGEVFPEVVLVNGHNGNVRFEMRGGLYRLACSNGLVTGVGHGRRVLTRHIGDANAIVDAAFQIVTETTKLSATLEKMLALKLEPEQIQMFATAVATAAYGAEHQLAANPVPLLTPRRVEDNKTDLWHVFNRLQENVIRGGAEYLSTKGRTVATKGITRIKRDVAFNVVLWQMAEQMLAGKPLQMQEVSDEELLG